MIRLIGLDLDGTLLTRDKRITQRTQIMLEEASRIGVHIVPVTGRPLSGIPRQVTDFPFIRYAITSNGAVVTDRKTGRTIRKRCMAVETAEEVLRVSEGEGIIREFFAEGAGFHDGKTREMLWKRFSGTPILRYLEQSGCESFTNGLSWYVLYYIDSHLYDFSPVITTGYKVASRIIEGVQKLMIRTLRKYGFESFDSFTPFKRKAQSRIPCRCTTGDGWLIGAEIVNHALSGTKGVACLQPFGCMPNHVCGHGLYSSIQRRLSDTGLRLVSVDFDSAGSEVNIYNRAEMLLTPMIINDKKGEKP